MARKIGIVLLVIVGVVALLGVGQQIAAESGEVVVLATLDADGAPYETRLWVVDNAGSQWLRSGGTVQRWYGHLLERPEVEVTRGGEAQIYVATPVPEFRDRTNALMAEKYGLADRFIGMLFGRSDTIPIRLDPR